MYSNYQSFPSMMPSSMSMPMNSMPRQSSSMNQSNRVVAGGFLGPFVLGGITGGLLAPAFYPRPYYNNYYYPYYGPYYR